MSETELNIIEAKPGDSEPSPTRKPDSRPLRKTRKSGRGLSVLAMIIAILALILSGYLAWQAWLFKQQTAITTQNQSSFKVGIEHLQSQVARQQARLNEATSGIEPMQQQLQEVQQREERLVSRLDGASQRIRDLEGTSREQWRLAEVEYLLRLANQRLLMGTDTASARSLLQSADDILKELDNYSLFGVREALAEDMAMVSAVPEFDQESTYLRLQGLNRLVPQLQLLDERRLQKAPQAEPSAEVAPEAEDWESKAKAMLLNTWSQFTGLFRIKTERTKPVEPLLSDQQEIMIRQNLQLMIEQAKLAVMTREQGIYRSSLKQAQEWVAHYFTLGGEAKNAMLTELEALSKVSMTSELPSINRSLEALKDYQSKLETPVSPASKPDKSPQAEKDAADSSPDAKPDSPEEKQPAQEAPKP